MWEILLLMLFQNLLQPNSRVQTTRLATIPFPNLLPFCEPDLILDPGVFNGERSQVLGFRLRLAWTSPAGIPR